MASSHAAGAPRTPSPLSLRANFGWIFLGTAAYSLSQWGLLVAVARIGTVDMVGQLALGFALVTPITLLFNLNLRAVQATDATDQYRFSTYLGLRLVSTLMGLAALMAIVLVIGYPVGIVALALVLGVAKAFDGVSDIVYGLLQKHERMDRIGLSLLSRGALSLALATALILVTHSIIWATAGMALAWLIWLFSYDLREARAFERARPDFSPSSLWQLSRLSLPLGIVMMLLSLANNIPRYFVERSHGLAELGYFAALAYLMIVGNTVVGALGQAASPRLARYHAEGDRRAFLSLLLRLLVISLVLGLLAVCVAIIFGRQVLEIIYGPDYAARNTLLVWLMVASMIGYVASVLGIAITAQRCFKPQLWLFTAVVLVQTGACALLVPRGGGVGAAQGLLIATAVQLVGSAWLVRRGLRLRGGELT